MEELPFSLSLEYQFIVSSLLEFISWPSAPCGSFLVVVMNLAVDVSGVKRCLSVILVVKTAAVSLHPPAAGATGKGLLVDPQPGFKGGC